MKKAKEADDFPHVKKEEKGKTSSLADLFIKVRVELGDDIFNKFAAINKK